MYQKFFDQAETLFKPITDMVATSQAVLETLANKQVNLIAEIWQDSMACAQKIAEVKDGNYLELQKAYWGGLNEKLSEAAQSSVDYLNVTQEKFTGIFQPAPLGDTFAEAAKRQAAPPDFSEVSTQAKPSASKVAAEPLQQAGSKTLGKVAPKVKSSAKTTSNIPQADEASSDTACVE